MLPKLYQIPPFLLTYLIRIFYNTFQCRVRYIGVEFSSIFSTFASTCFYLLINWRRFSPQHPPHLPLCVLPLISTFFLVSLFSFFASNICLINLSSSLVITWLRHLSCPCSMFIWTG